MKLDEIIPTEFEVYSQVMAVLKHVMNFEYFRTYLKLPIVDSQSPHDIAGIGSKYLWPVLKGMALRFRTPNVDYDKYILPSIRIHRLQRHHRMWNYPDPKDADQPNSSAAEDDLKIGAADAVCSLLENRIYQQGAHTYEEIFDIIDNKDHPLHPKSRYQREWMKRLDLEMKAITLPALDLIKEPYASPDLGLSRQTYIEISNSTNDALFMLMGRGYRLYPLPDSYSCMCKFLSKLFSKDK